MPAFTIAEMTENSAAQIASWKYPPPYEIYSFGGNAAEREELLNGLHFAVYQDSFGKEPCGFIALGWSAQIQEPACGKSTMMNHIRILHSACVRIYAAGDTERSLCKAPWILYALFSRKTASA